MRITPPTFPHPPLKPSGPRVELEKQSGLKGAPDAADATQAKLQEACRDFESIFLNMLLSKMRDSIPKSDLMGSSRGEELYRGMLDEELARQMAASGGVGLAATLYAQLAGPEPAKPDTNGQTPGREDGIPR